RRALALGAVWFALVGAASPRPPEPPPPDLARLIPFAQAPSEKPALATELPLPPAPVELPAFPPAIPAPPAAEKPTAFVQSPRGLDGAAAARSGPRTRHVRHAAVRADAVAARRMGTPRARAVALCARPVGRGRQGMDSGGVAWRAADDRARRPLLARRHARTNRPGRARRDDAAPVHAGRRAPVVPRGRAATGVVGARRRPRAGGRDLVPRVLGQCGE